MGFAVKDLRKVTQAVVAMVFGVSGPMVKKSGCPRNADGSYSLIDVGGWAWGKRERRNVSKSKSEALEEWRLTKARRERVALERDIKSLLDREQCRAVMMELAGIMKTLGERVEQVAGVEARRCVDEAIDEFETRVRRAFDPALDTGVVSLGALDKRESVAGKKR